MSYVFVRELIFPKIKIEACKNYRIIIERVVITGIRFEDIHFDTERCILLPGVQHGTNDQDQLDGLAVVKTLQHTKDIMSMYKQKLAFIPDVRNYLIYDVFPLSPETRHRPSGDLDSIYTDENDD